MCLDLVQNATKRKSVSEHGDRPAEGMRMINSNAKNAVIDGGSMAQMHNHFAPASG